MLGKRGNHVSEEETPEAGHEPDYEQHFDVKEAFARLEEEERMILSYSVFAGYGSEEIAQILEMNAATVRSKKSRACVRCWKQDDLIRDGVEKRIEEGGGKDGRK